MFEVFINGFNNDNKYEDCTPLFVKAGDELRIAPDTDKEERVEVLDVIDNGDGELVLKVKRNS